MLKFGGGGDFYEPPSLPIYREWFKKREYIRLFKSEENGLTAEIITCAEHGPKQSTKARRNWTITDGVMTLHFSFDIPGLSLP